MAETDDTLRLEIAAALILHDHPEQNSLTRPDEPMLMLVNDPKFHLCAKALAQADALLPLIREHTTAAVQAERERISALLASVPDEYYPEDVFGGPFSTDESRMANEALKEHGLTIDRISANVMRHAYRVAASLAAQEPDDG